MPKKAKEILMTLDEMAGLSQVIVIDANCDGLIPEIKKVSKKTVVRDVREVTNTTNPLDDEIHDALQGLGVSQLVLVTENCKHFFTPKKRTEAKYFLVCLAKGEILLDVIAKDLIFALRHDPGLKGRRIAGDYKMVVLSKDYLKELRNRVKRPPTAKSKKTG